MRAGSDVRIIVHRTAASFVLCYADHHDKAYAWAQRRRLERHPTTGAAQLVDIHETVEQIIVPDYARSGAASDAASPLGNCTDHEMLSWGVPTDWIEPLRAADEELLLAIAERLPAEAAEAVLEVATGGSPRCPSHPRLPNRIPRPPRGAEAFSRSFAAAEWTHIVDLHNLTTWESYQEIPRLGRKTRLPESRRRELWSLYEQLRAELAARGVVTMSQRCDEMAATLRGGTCGPYTHVVVDEAQDVSPAQLVFLSALAGNGADALFFAGDTGQRIFRQPFSWVRLGVSGSARACCG